MGRNMTKENIEGEKKVQALACLQKASELTQKILAEKHKEILLDHENDLVSQQVLELLRQIKYESTQERISAYAHVGETYMKKQIELDLKDDEPFTKARDFVVQMSNLIDKAIEEVRKL